MKGREGGRDGRRERSYGGYRHEILTQNLGNSVVREPGLAVSVIRPNRNFCFSNMGVVKLIKMDKKLNFCVDSWRAADRIRPFKVNHI